MTSDKALVNILQEQVETYKKLFDLLKQERKHLVNIEAEKIEQLSKEKDTVIMRLRLLEEERQRLVKKCAEDYHIEDQICLKDLGRITGNKDFLFLRSQLLPLLQSIEEMNEFNSILIDRSINYIRTTSNFINSFTRDDVKKNKGVLISKET